MSSFQQKITRQAQEKVQYDETKQASEPDSDMAQILEFSYQEFRMTMITMLRLLMGKENNRQEQKGNVSRRVETEVSGSYSYSYSKR